jgi:hypothetical protein
MQRYKLVAISSWPNSRLSTMCPLQELLLQEAQELLLSTLPSYTGDSSALHPSTTFRKASEADVLRPVVIGERKLIYRAVLWIRIRIDFWLSWI